MNNDYRMTPLMRQDLRNKLRKYHTLFNYSRCQAWQLEELIVKAINSDIYANHSVIWSPSGHNVDWDISVMANDIKYPIQIKSGQTTAKHLILSGHRLGRFKGDFTAISDYLNSKTDNIISVSYNCRNDDNGMYHDYCVRHINHYVLADVESDKWVKKGKSYYQENKHGTKLSISPSMSWQVWWRIPLEKIVESDSFSIEN